MTIREGFVITREKLCDYEGDVCDHKGEVGDYKRNVFYYEGEFGNCKMMFVIANESL